jgi:hypothetical protein
MKYLLRTSSPSTPNRSPKIMNQNQTPSKPADAEQESGKGLDEAPCSRSCIVHGCQNRTDQGTFVGDLCKPCRDSLASGKIGPTTSFLGGMIPARNYSRQPSACEAVERVPVDQLRDAWDWAATYLVELERRISSEITSGARRRKPNRGPRNAATTGGTKDDHIIQDQGRSDCLQNPQTDEAMSDTPTPETDACWDDRTGCNILDHARRLERERDKARQQSAIYAAEREHNAMQALIFQSERDEAREQLTAEQTLADRLASTVAVLIISLNAFAPEPTTIGKNAYAEWKKARK